MNLTAKPNENYRFSRWEIESSTGASIANANSADTVLTVGASDVYVKAYFEKAEEPTPASYSVTKGAGARGRRAAGSRWSTR